MSRRFLLTYQREGEPFIEIEGVQFSDGRVVLDCYPDNEWPGTRGFRDFAHMEFVINEFGDASIEWLDDEEEKESHLHYPSDGGSYLAPTDAIDAIIHDVALISPTREVQA